MKIAIIPARGGSKRIPHKNIKPFCGKPIIAYSIEAAQKSGCFDDIIVSTDDQEIAALAARLGAKIPFIRPNNISDDHATTLEVLQHAIAALSLDPKDILCCLYATAPFVQPSDLVNAVDTLSKEPVDYVFSATEFRFPIQRALKINSNGLVKMFHPEHMNTRSQDLELAYHDAGQFYIGTVEPFANGKPFFCNSLSKAILLPSYRVQDIDTIEDWEKAERMFTLLAAENDKQS